MKKKNDVDAVKIYNNNLSRNLLTFHGDLEEIIGSIDYENGEIVFTGNANESAKVFFNYVKQYFKEIEQWKNLD